MSTSTHQARRPVSWHSLSSLWRALAAAWRLRHARMIFAVVPTLALGFAAWSFFAPPQLGGGTSYAVTDGVSMLPNFHAGDVVLLRHETAYKVGEVAGYRNGQLGVTVMHRIIAVNADHYVFKGDNNSWIDTDQPLASQIVGAEWVHLSGWGKLLATLRAPVAAAFLLGLLWIVVFWPRSRSKRQRIGRSRRRT
jgi:signal peptidase I